MGRFTRGRRPGDQRRPRCAHRDRRRRGRNRRRRRSSSHADVDAERLEAHRPAVFALNGALILIVAITAYYFPARWAGKVDPVEVFRDILQDFAVGLRADA